MRKILILLVFFNLALAQTFPSQSLPPVINCGQDFFQCLAFFFDKILRIILVLAISLSAIFIAWAGILYITGGQEVKKIHPKIVWAAVGLVIALLAFVFVKMIEFWISNPQNVQIFPIVNFALAQIQEPELPQTISCGPIKLPSVFQKTDLGKNVWSICFFYYLERFLSLFYQLALFLGVIFLSWAGILYITNPGKATDVHKKLIYGVAGIILAILSLTIVKLIELFFLKL